MNGDREAVGTLSLTLEQPLMQHTSSKAALTTTPTVALVTTS
ncbi:hypothetical protein [Nesterenkonia salmonea]|nr:hypothetical protein [Nesterenkonia salmonea]